MSFACAVKLKGTPSSRLASIATCVAREAKWAWKRAGGVPRAALASCRASFTYLRGRRRSPSAAASGRSRRRAALAVLHSASVGSGSASTRVMGPRRVASSRCGTSAAGAWSVKIDTSTPRRSSSRISLMTKVSERRGKTLTTYPTRSRAAGGSSEAGIEGILALRPCRTHARRARPAHAAVDRSGRSPGIPPPHRVYAPAHSCSRRGAAYDAHCGRPEGSAPPELSDALEPQAVLVPGPGWRADAHLHDQGPPERHAHRHGGPAVVPRRVGRAADDPHPPPLAPRRGPGGGGRGAGGPRRR